MVDTLKYFAAFCGCIRIIDISSLLSSSNVEDGEYSPNIDPVPFPALQYCTNQELTIK